MAASNKIKLKIGITLIGVSFFGVVLVLYVMGKETIKSVQEVGELQERLTLIETEKFTTEDQLTRVTEQLNTIELDHILKKADQVYGEEEKSRREGILWMDHEASQYVVTLGVLNGLEPGSRLNVYEGTRMIGQVVVDTPLDVISYVNPLDDSLQEMDGSYYKVAVE